MHGKRGICSHFLTPIKVNILQSVDPAVVKEQCPAVLLSNVPEIGYHDHETQSKIAHPKGVELDRICRVQEGWETKGLPTAHNAVN